MVDFYTLLFKRLNIPVCRKWLSEKVKGIPYPNSMYGLGVVLSMYNVQNRCVKLSDRNELQSVDKPCVVIYNGSFSIVNSATPEMVELLDSHKKTTLVQWPEFKERWDGVVMLIHVDENSREPDYEKHIAEEQTQESGINGLHGPAAYKRNYTQPVERKFTMVGASCHKWFGWRRFIYAASKTVEYSKQVCRQVMRSSQGKPLRECDKF